MQPIKTEKVFTPQIESGVEVTMSRIRTISNPNHLAILQSAKILQKDQSFFVPVEIAPKNFLVNLCNALNKENATRHYTARVKKDSFGNVTGFRFYRSL